MPYSRRQLLRLATGAGAASLLAACAGPGGSSSSTSTTDGPISFAHWRAEDKEVFEQIIKDSKLSVRQDISPSNDYQSTALQKLRGGSVGDAFTAFRGAQFLEIAKAGIWTDL